MPVAREDSTWTRISQAPHNTTNSTGMGSQMGTSPNQNQCEKKLFFFNLRKYFIIFLFQLEREKILGLKPLQPSFYNLDIENKASISAGRAKGWLKPYTRVIAWILNPVISETMCLSVTWADKVYLITQARLGWGFLSPAIIRVLNKRKPLR